MVATSVKPTAAADDAFFANILAAIDSNPAVETKSTLPKLTTQQRINDFINRGISFAVKADAFEIAEGAENLTPIDTDYLVSNADRILCHLQQMLLCKEIFDHEPTILGDFKAAVTEREGFVTEKGQDFSLQVYEEAAMDITKFWFADIFKEEL